MVTVITMGGDRDRMGGDRDRMGGDRDRMGVWSTSFF